MPSSPAHLAPNVVGKSLQGLSTLGDQSGTKMMHQERTHLTAKLLNAFSLKLCGNGSSISCSLSQGEEVVDEEEGVEEKEVEDEEEGGSSAKASWGDGDGVLYHGEFPSAP